MKGDRTTREPDATYTTLKDRAVYLLDVHLRVVNCYYKEAYTNPDPDFRKYNQKRMREARDVFDGMVQMFEATFRDYKVVVEVDEYRDRLVYGIETR